MTTTPDDDEATAPPYEGRRETADVDNADSGASERKGARVGGATGPVESEDRPPKPGPPGGVSPAQEQPSDETPEGEPTDEGVGPTHTAGTPRGEDHASGR
jgi:hypothetical protein